MLPHDTKMYFYSFDVKVSCNQIFFIQSAPDFRVSNSSSSLKVLDLLSIYNFYFKWMGVGQIIDWFQGIQIGTLLDNSFAGFGSNHFNHGNEYQSTTMS